MEGVEETIQMLESSTKQQRPLNIVVTGCNSGIGLQACKLLRRLSSDNRLFLAARTLEKAEHAAREICISRDEQPTQNDHSHENTISTTATTTIPISSDSHCNIYPMACDHTSFQSVRAFCSELKCLLKLIGDNESEKAVGIDVLCLNAAILLGEDTQAEFTEDNIELTMQTNHYTPFLIGNLLFDLINPNGRVVITSSGLHAFASFGDFKGVVVNEGSGKIDDPSFPMLDGKTYNHKDCYAISKLCNSAFCAALDRRLRSSRNAISVCFTPGLIPSSGLFRRQKLWHETALNKETSGMVETEEWGGVLLAWMILSDEVGKEGGKYWRAPFGVSRRGGKIPDDIYAAPMNGEAEDVKNQEALWRISTELTEMQESEFSVIG